MITNNQIKLIKSLARKKDRHENGLFVVEGNKMIQELIDAGHEVKALYGTDDVFADHPKFEKISSKDLGRISSYKTASEALAILPLPHIGTIDTSLPSILLEDVNDPGNLGTIIRTADWFGIKQIICSEQSVDCFNPKVISATKGSIFRIQIHYTSLSNFIKTSPIPTYATLLEGKDIRTCDLQKEAHWLFGSESHGLSSGLSSLASEKYTIPSFASAAESLNLGISVGIVFGFSKLNVQSIK